MQLKLFANDKTVNKSGPSDEIVNVASVPQRSPFRYPGGKTWFVPTLRKWLKSKDVIPDLLIEPFAGGGTVGLTAAFENLSKKVLLVELDPHVAAVWHILIEGNYEKLAKRILAFKLTNENAQAALSKSPRSTDEKAFQTILRNRVSHGGIMAPGAGLIKNGENGKGISSRWYPETLAKRIMDIGAVRSKLSFYEGDAFEIIQDYIDDSRTSYFIDPPYTAAGKKAGRRLYSHHALDHHKLFDTLKTAKGDFIFTYDNSEELKEMAALRGFQTKLIAMKNTHHAEMTELIIGRDIEWLKI
jgi:DNA adenine methylase